MLIKVDVPTWRTPFVNYALIAVIVIVSFIGFFDSDFFMTLAGIKVTPFSPITGARPVIELSAEQLPLPALAVTSSFLHGGYIHLIGNMLFLWVFGNAINYKFGHLGYIGLYLICALVGGMAHYVLVGTPFVGASGAINGVMGAFLVLFPRNDISVARIVTFPSYWLLLLWIGWDVYNLATPHSAGVALWAHVGGVLAGLVVTITCVLLKWIKSTDYEQNLLQIVGIGADKAGR